jgi:hypothetical protein
MGCEADLRRLFASARSSDGHNSVLFVGPSGSQRSRSTPAPCGGAGFVAPKVETERAHAICWMSP